MIYFDDAQDICDNVSDGDVAALPTRALKTERAELQKDAEDLRMLIRELEDHLNDIEERLADLEDELDDREAAEEETASEVA